MVEVEHPIFSIQSIIWGDMPEYGTSAGQLDLQAGELKSHHKKI